MEINRSARFLAAIACLISLLIGTGALLAAAAAPKETSGLWSHDNLLAWCVVPFDAAHRAPEARAQMLNKLGFRYFAYDWREKDIPTFDAEIEALQRHRIELVGWWFPLSADDPKAKSILEIFQRHHVHPQLWVAQSFNGFPKTPEEWQKLLPAGVAMPKSEEERARLPEADNARLQEGIRKATSRLYEESLTKTPQEQEMRVKQEADRINALVKLAAPYGIKVELYNHNGWFGMMDNQLAIINRLQEIGVFDDGIVYNFSHARDELHDDTVDFPALWKRIQRHVVVVDITGMLTDGNIIYPSQGDRELDMMRTIQDSGWRGRIGLIGEKGGDAETTLTNYLIGLDWLASQLQQKNPDGRPPFAKVH